VQENDIQYKNDVLQADYVKKLVSDRSVVFSGYSGFLNQRN
jgi:hypothetical protein